MVDFVDKLFSKWNKRRYDDRSERFSYVYTSLVLLFLAALVTAKEQFGSPIKCWVSAEFRMGWEQYVENLCYISETYFLPYNVTIRSEIRHRHYRKISYYQWVPFVLMGQSLLFFLPHLVWRTLNGFTGTNLCSLTQMCCHLEVERNDERKKCLSSLVAYLNDCLLTKRRFGLTFIASFIYFLVKLLFVCNACIQMYVLNKFFVTTTPVVNNSTTFWGWNVVSDLLQGKNWEHSGHFPRVTLCDVSERQLNNIHVHTVQCVLMINMLNEKIYLFLWFWFLLIAVYLSTNLLFSAATFLPAYNRYKTIRHYLKIGLFKQQNFSSREENTNSNRIWMIVNDQFDNGRYVEKFICDFLRLDGALLFRFLTNFSGEMVASEICIELFKVFLRSQQPNGAENRRASKNVRTFANDQTTMALDNGFLELTGY